MKPLHALVFLTLLSCGTKNSSTENAYTPTKDTVAEDLERLVTDEYYLQLLLKNE